MPGSPAYAEEPHLNLERLGDMLHRLREQRGDDLQYIADFLCIKRNFLEALENSHYDELPADAYVIGFLRSYANYLGIDGKEAIDRYRNEMAGRRKKPSLVLPTPISEGRTPSAIILVGTAIAAIFIYAVWYGLSTSDRTAISKPSSLPAATATENSSNNILPPPPAPASATTPEVIPAPTNTDNAAQNKIVAPIPLAPPPSDSGIMLSSAAPAATTGLAPAAVPAATMPSTTPAPNAPQNKLATATTQPAIAGSPDQNAGSTGKEPHIVIHTTQSSWVLVTDNHGLTIYDHVMKPGDTYRVPDRSGLFLTTGNGAGVYVTLDGTDLPRLANGPSRVIRNVALDGEHLRNLPPLPDE